MVKVMRWILAAVTLLAVIVFSLIAPIDRTPIEQQSFFKTSLARLDSAQPSMRSPKSTLLANWGSVNVTPDHPMPLAGYTFRKDFNAVYDSLFFRILAFRVADKEVYIISADLLLFPPIIRTNLEHRFKSEPNVFLYFSATHTHNGVGGWDDSLIGNLALGSYNQTWVEKTTSSIVEKIEFLKSNMQRAELTYFEADAAGYSINRVDAASAADQKLRGFSVTRLDGQRAVLFSFSAHATSISKKSQTLSGDYPAAVIRNIEKNGYAFAMFLSGMVGSHRLNGIAEQEFELVEKAGVVLGEKVVTARESESQDSIALQAMNFKMEFGPSQLRISKNWKVRDWVFRQVVSPLRGDLTFLELGSIVLIGTPCDFSGEISVMEKLDSLAQTHGRHLIITSFNGNYDGYITADHHYETSRKEEIMTLNWVGPFHGRFFADVIKKLISKSPN